MVGGSAPIAAKDGDTITVSLPKSVEPYKDDIRRFMEAMVYKLAKNAHKGRWEGLGAMDTFRFMMGEMTELEDAIQGGNMIEIMLESADVANFALITAAIAMERGR